MCSSSMQRRCSQDTYCSELAQPSEHVGPGSGDTVDISSCGTYSDYDSCGDSANSPMHSPDSGVFDGLEDATVFCRACGSNGSAGVTPGCPQCGGGGEFAHLRGEAMEAKVRETDALIMGIKDRVRAELYSGLHMTQVRRRGVLESACTAIKYRNEAYNGAAGRRWSAQQWWCIDEVGWVVGRNRMSEH